jgi:hypothetical protein
MTTFARQVHRAHGEAARVAELGYRVVHAELIEQRNPYGAIERRGRQAVPAVEPLPEDRPRLTLVPEPEIEL